MPSLTPKQILGSEIAKKVQNNQVIGLGTGSTAKEAIKAIGERIQNEKLVVYGAPTSNRAEELAKNVGIIIVNDSISPFNNSSQPPLNLRGGDNFPIDWGFDGADEVEQETLNILKGGWGCMTREKLVAKKCQHWIVMVDPSKFVDELGKRFPIPVEVQEDQMHRVIENLYEKYQPVDITVRQNKDGSGEFRTDFGNPIIDVKVAPGSIQREWEKEWEMMPGIVGTGLFLGGYPNEVWIGKNDGIIQKLPGPGNR
jgi:ribose 5-phosphate isomerase A